MMMIVVGIPTCIKMMEVVIMYRFCKDFDEDENAHTGGTTMCECCTKTITCRYWKEWRNKKKHKNIESQDDEGGDDEFEQTATQSKISAKKPSQ